MPAQALTGGELAAFIDSAIQILIGSHGLKTHRHSSKSGPERLISLSAYGGWTSAPVNTLSWSSTILYLNLIRKRMPGYKFADDRSNKQANYDHSFNA
jgi:hypothetical protein